MSEELQPPNLETDSIEQVTQATEATIPAPLKEQVEVKALSLSDCSDAELLKLHTSDATELGAEASELREAQQKIIDIAPRSSDVYTHETSDPRGVLTTGSLLPRVHLLAKGLFPQGTSGVFNSPDQKMRFLEFRKGVYSEDESKYHSLLIHFRQVSDRILRPMHGLVLFSSSLHDTMPIITSGMDSDKGVRGKNGIDGDDEFTGESERSVFEKAPIPEGLQYDASVRGDSQDVVFIPDSTSPEKVCASEIAISDESAILIPDHVAKQILEELLVTDDSSPDDIYNKLLKTDQFYKLMQVFDTALDKISAGESFSSVEHKAFWEEVVSSYNQIKTELESPKKDKSVVVEEIARKSALLRAGLRRIGGYDETAISRTFLCDDVEQSGVVADSIRTEQLGEETFVYAEREKVQLAFDQHDLAKKALELAERNH